MFLAVWGFLRICLVCFLAVTNSIIVCRTVDWENWCDSTDVGEKFICPLSF